MVRGRQVRPLPDGRGLVLGGERRGAGGGEVLSLVSGYKSFICHPLRKSHKSSCDFHRLNPCKMGFRVSRGYSDKCREPGGH